MDSHPNPAGTTFGNANSQTQPRHRIVGKLRSKQRLKRDFWASQHQRMW
jgi:hypothetical protein